MHAQNDLDLHILHLFENDFSFWQGPFGFLPFSGYVKFADPNQIITIGSYLLGSYQSEL